MCGRYALRSSTPTLAKALGAEPRGIADDTGRSFNIAPSQSVLTCRATATGSRELVQMRWGLIPSWSKGDSHKFNMTNARAESITEKPAYRTPFRYRRCLIPADGFYEWRRTESHKQPYFIRMRDGAPFAFAGVFEKWKPKDGGAVTSCSFITTDANETLSPIHHRMPVIIDTDHYEAWLYPTSTDPNHLTPMLTRFDANLMEAYPVSTFVNKAANDDERCWQPIAADQP